MLPLGVARRRPPRGVAAMGPVPVDVSANALARHLAVPPGALRAASLRKQSFLRRIRTGARAYALARPLAGTSLRSCAHSLRSLRGFPPKHSFFGASVPGLEHKLSPGGVCSRILHSMLKQCCITYHRGCHILYQKIGNLWVKSGQKWDWAVRERERLDLQSWIQAV